MYRAKWCDIFMLEAKKKSYQVNNNRKFEMCYSNLLEVSLLENNEWAENYKWVEIDQTGPCISWGALFRVRADQSTLLLPLALSTNSSFPDAERGPSRADGYHRPWLPSWRTTPRLSRPRAEELASADAAARTERGREQVDRFTTFLVKRYTSKCHNTFYSVSTASGFVRIHTYVSLKIPSG
jgi:hypothetical protein